MKTKNLILFFIISVFAISHARSQVFERTKSISHCYPISKQTIVKISNKYGDVMINTWEKDSVAITVNIKVTDKKEFDAESKLGCIDAQFTSTQYYVESLTVFKDNKTAINANISELTSSIFNSKRNVSINYSITLPEWANLTINNKYGNVFTARHTGNFTLSLSYGDFKGAELLGESVLTVNFGNVTLNNINNGKLEIGYSEMTLKQGGKIQLESRSSKFWLNTLQSLDINSKRDKFYIDTIASLNGLFDFTTVQIGAIADMMTLKMNYGDLKVSQIGSKLKNISLNSQYTDIVIGIPAQLSFTLTADYKKTSVTLPASFKDIKPQLIDEKNQQYKINGMVGSESIPITSIQLNASYGSFSFVNY